VRFFSSYTTLIILALAGVVQPVSQIPPNTEKSATGLPSLTPEAQRAILAELKKDNASWSQQAELMASDGAANDEFGYSIAASGSTVVVGAPNHAVGSNVWQGAAYVFVRNGTTWTQQAELMASDGLQGDNFGLSVAISGNTIVVGAPSHGVTRFADGAAYVYMGSGGTWTEQAELNGAGYFGVSLAISGSTVVVGAEGAAYVFAESGGTWSQQAELTASDGAAGDFFGSSVAVDGSTVLVGALYHTVGSNADQGAAYVFAESGGTWSQQAQLTSPDGASVDYFGGSVALDGGTAVVGAFNHPFRHNIPGPGSAYVFVQNGTTWTQQAELSASHGAANDFFGYSVMVMDGTVMVGGPNHAISSHGGQGAAYVYVGGSGTWSEQAELTASDGAAGDFFGFVAISGSTVVVGADCHPASPTACGPGAAYVFVSGTTAPSYSLTASPSNLSVAQGSQGTSTITITPVNGFSGTVLLSASGLPDGVTEAFNPNPATSTSTLTLTASGTTTTGTATVTVTGTSGSLTETTTLALTVTPPQPVGVVSPTSLNFGSVPVGTTSPEKVVALENTGNATMVVSSVSVSGPFAVAVNKCQNGVKVGTHCNVWVTYTPLAVENDIGTLTFTDNASNSPQSVSLSGTGIAGSTK